MIVESWLMGDKVIISDNLSRAQTFNQRNNFGSIINKTLELSLSEALYLMEKGKIVIYNKTRRPLSVVGFSRLARLIDPRFYTRYSVFRDLRSKGFIPKAAFKFGADFLVYDKGVKPGKGHSRWACFALVAGESLNTREISAMMRVSHAVKKDLLVGVVDSDQGVTYYSINWEKIR